MSAVIYDCDDACAELQHDAWRSDSLHDKSPKIQMTRFSRGKHPRYWECTESPPRVG